MWGRIGLVVALAACPSELTFAQLQIQGVTVGLPHIPAAKSSVQEMIGEVVAIDRAGNTIICRWRRHDWRFRVDASTTFELGAAYSSSISDLRPHQLVRVRYLAEGRTLKALDIRATR